MKKILITIAAIFLLSGCGSLKYEDAKPSNKLYAFQDKTLPSQLLIVRDTGSEITGGLDVYIDNIFAAVLAPSERATFYLAEGDHTVFFDNDSLGGGVGIKTAKEKPTKLRVSNANDGGMHCAFFLGCTAPQPYTTYIDGVDSYPGNRIYRASVLRQGL